MNQKIFIGAIFLLASRLIFAAASLPDCPAAKLSMNGQYEDECISTCTAIASEAGAQIASGSSGFCAGNATESKITLREVKLGVSGNPEATCNLWSGNFVIDKSQYALGNEISAGGTFNICPSGTYDVVYITTLRFETFAGSTTFPDGSGKVAKTTSTFASGDTRYTDKSLWLETGTSHSDDNLEYVRPTSNWNTAYKKLANSPSSSDLSSASAVEMIFDWAKMHVINKTTGLLPGWYCESGGTDVCERIDDDGYLEGRYTKDVDGVSFPSSTGIVVTESIQPNWNISYYGLNTSVERGLRFLWHNDSGAVKYLGANPGESGLQITISPIKIYDAP
jgi:hypothetical protein